MRGDYLHNHVLLDPLERPCREHGAQVHREYNLDGEFVDLLIEFDTGRVVVEAELSPDRVANDVAKAQRLGANVLLIVVPTWRIARAVKRKLARLDVPRPEGLIVHVDPLGVAVQRVTRMMSTCRSVNAHGQQTRRTEP